MDLIWEAWGIEKPEEEYKFHPVRKWKFDYCWTDKKIAVEIEGAVWVQGRHTRGSGFIKDIEKYNAAGRLGFRVFRFTPQQIKSGEAQNFMQKVLTEDSIRRGLEDVKAGRVHKAKESFLNNVERDDKQEK